MNLKSRWYEITSRYYSLILLFIFHIFQSLKAVKDQEEQAQSQLQALWNACEKQRREVAELDRAIEYEQRAIALDKSIDTQVSERS